MLADDSSFAFLTLVHATNVWGKTKNGGMIQMQKNNNNIWIPLVASVGVGAATFYSMTKNEQGIGQTMQKMIPFVNQMSNAKDTQTLGPHGMS
ncbi:hypothetical protein ACFSMW_15990 [Virgibacillus halophilus]